MNYVRFFILMMLFCKMYFAQCPQNYKVSKIQAGQCIKNTVCDGWVFVENVKVCLDKDPTVLPYPGKPSVQCKLTQGNQALDSIYICKNCPAQSPFGFDCVACKSDEYQYFIQPSIGCIKKTDYGSQKYRGYLAVDKVSIILECPNGQIYEENTTKVTSQNELIITQKCKQCPIDAPFESTDKTRCTQNCNTGLQREIIDKRNTPNKCILTKDCKGFIAWEEWACKISCNPGEVVLETFLNVSVCKKCPKDKPYVSIDKTSCVSSCGPGNIYGEKEKSCIPYSACNGFIKDDNFSICLEKSCHQNQSGVNAAYFLNGKKQGQNYQTCSQCPIDTPFINTQDPTKCFGCDSSQLINFIIGGCSSITAFKQSEGNMDSSGKRIYPLNQCPQGEYISSLGQCSKCPPGIMGNMISSPNSKFCCQKDQLFNIVDNQCDKKQCANRIEPLFIKKILASDGKTCVSQCEKDEIEVYPLNSNQLQCQKCKLPIVYEGDCKKECQSGQSFSEKLNECINTNDCQGYFPSDGRQKVCLSSSYYCPAFDFDSSIPSSFWSKINKNGFQCNICPFDKPFLEVALSDAESPVCTRCLDKIRDYDSGRCVSSIDQINNVGTGIFFVNRLEYWPKRLNKQCNSSITSFAYKDLGLKECVSINVQQTSCNSLTEVFDERTKTCTKPEMCSAILSNDRKTCSLSQCKIDEIIVQIFNNASLQNNTSSLYSQGYSYQCSLCPKDKPHKQPNGDCGFRCPPNYILDIKGTLCIDMSQCPIAEDQNLFNCVQQCKDNKLIIQGQKIKECGFCPQSQPYYYNFKCYNECPISENVVSSLSQKICIPTSQCKSTISKLGKYCLDICPPNFFLDAKFQNKCVEKCEFNEVQDLETYKCLFDYQCSKFMSISHSDCLEQCPPFQYYFIKKEIVNDKWVELYKKCVDKCPSEHYLDPQMRQCKPWKECRQSISNSGDRCIESCPYGEVVSQNNQCIPCSKKPPFIYFDGRYCVSNCSSLSLVIDEETNYCIDPLKCKKVISLDGKSCVSSCQVGTPVTSNSVTQCKCPPNSPYANRKNNPNQCVDTCYVSESQNDYKFCLDDKGSCQKTYMIDNLNGTFECADICPGDHVFGADFGNLFCVTCPNNYVVFDNSCNRTCPNGYLSKPDFRGCQPSIQCEDIIDTENKDCNKSCPSSQIIIEKEYLCFPHYVQNIYSEFQFYELSNSQLEALIKISQYRSPNNQSSLLNQEMVQFQGLSQNIMNNVSLLGSNYTREKAIEIMKLFSTANYFLGVFAENQYILQLNKTFQLQKPEQYYPSLQKLAQYINDVSQITQEQLKLTGQQLDQLKDLLIYQGQQVSTWIEKLSKTIISLNQTLFSPIQSLEQMLIISTNLCIPRISKFCIKEVDCLPPMGLVEINGMLICKSNISGLILDKINTRQDKLMYLNDPKKCQGVISQDRKSCGQTCNLKEEAVADVIQGFSYCVKCKKYQQFNCQASKLECVEQCMEGFIANDSGICFPIIENTIRHSANNNSTTSISNPSANKEEVDSQSKVLITTDSATNKSQIKNCNEQDNNNSIVVAIISISAFIFLQILVFGIYLKIKRYNHKNPSNQNVILQVKKNSIKEGVKIPHQYAVSSVNELNEIEFHKPHTSSSIQTANQL